MAMEGTVDKKVKPKCRKAVRAWAFKTPNYYHVYPGKTKLWLVQNGYLPQMIVCVEIRELA